MARNMKGSGHIVDVKVTVVVPDIFSVTVHTGDEFLMGHAPPTGEPNHTPSLSCRKVNPKASE